MVTFAYSGVLSYPTYSECRSATRRLRKNAEADRLAKAGASVHPLDRPVLVLGRPKMTTVALTNAGRSVHGEFGSTHRENMWLLPTAAQPSMFIGS